MIAIALQNEKKRSSEENAKMIIDFPKDNSEMYKSNEKLKMMTPLHYRTTCAFDPIQIAGSPPGGHFIYNLKRRIEIHSANTTKATATTLHQ